MPSRFIRWHPGISLLLAHPECWLLKDSLPPVEVWSQALFVRLLSYPCPTLPKLPPEKPAWSWKPWHCGSTVNCPYKVTILCFKLLSVFFKDLLCVHAHVYVCACAHACFSVCAPSACNCLWRPEEGIGQIPWSWSFGCLWATWYRCWEPNLGPL